MNSLIERLMVMQKLLDTAKGDIQHIINLLEQFLPDTKHENGFCDPQCPFLWEDKVDDDITIGFCRYLNTELAWYDYWNALCVGDKK
jgi:hypothetical protein